jgi:poly-gamma-glutamate capsule biosynthesis protein CapA/YwtB (metallophosphatase superfamily)
MPKTSILSLLTQIILLSSLAAQNTDTSRLSILFTGDIMGHDSQIAAAYEPDSDRYDYTFCFEYLEPLIQKADMAIGNLEVTFGGPPYKGYPRFSSPDELCTALKDAGFDILVNANNHALDRGKEGLERTIRTTAQGGIIMTGSFESEDQRDLRYPLIVEKNNILLAILNYTYGTNKLEPSPPNIVNYIDTAVIHVDIQKALAVRPDFIIACLHWGNEYEREANRSQEELARYLFKEGVDVIIGSHPHVVQPIKIICDEPDSSISRLVVYSLGNFISNQRERYRNGGIIFELELIKSGKTNISGYSYLPVWVYKTETDGKPRFRLIPANAPDRINESLNMPDNDREQLDQFYSDTRTHLMNIPENTFYQDSQDQ